jgi:hypothetical protein
MKSHKRARCYSVLTNSDDRCSNTSLPGSRFCWQHYPKFPLYLALAVSLAAAILMLPIQDCWRKLFPSQELKSIDIVKQVVTLSNQTLNSAIIIVDVIVQSRVEPNKKYLLNPVAQMNWFMKISGRRDNFFVATTNEFAVLPSENQNKLFRAQFTLHKSCSAFGKPITDLAKTEEIDIVRWLPDSLKVISGTANIILNNTSLGIFQIDSQVITQGTLWIRDVEQLHNLALPSSN